MQAFLKMSFSKSYALKMINLDKKDTKENPKKEFESLKLLGESPYVIKLFNKDFYCDEFYYFVTEFCEVYKIKNYKSD